MKGETSMQIKFNEETIDAINKKFEEETRCSAYGRNAFTLQIDDTIGGTHIYRQYGSSGFSICGVEQLGDMIDKLETMRSIIQAVTGIRFDA